MLPNTIKIGFKMLKSINNRFRTFINNSLLKQSMNLGIKRKIIIMEAPIWKRVLAFLIDYIIINSFILFPFNNIMKKLLNTNDITQILSMISNNNINTSAIIYISLFMSIMALLYFTILESKLNQTIGKIIMKIYIINIKNPKEKRISFFQAIIRGLGVFLIFTLPLITLLDAVYVYFNKDKQRFLERISKTKTISAARI